MAKEISYKYVAGEINHGTADKPNIEQIVNLKKFICKTQASYDANYPIAAAEAIPGTIEVTGDFGTETDTFPTLEERVGTVEDDVSDLAEALDMILNEVTE